jgi:LAO/AO transport system kinase
MEVTSPIRDLIERLKQGDVSALARSITLLEEGSLDIPSVDTLLGAANPSLTIGVTGPPGAGKSSLIDWLIKHMRDEGAMVGVLATDPSSPFTGGAILGDRIRMQHHFLDEKVFIRSLGSRGAQGGISRITRDAAHLMRAAGYRYIILETVGVGQTELDIMNLADTVLVVLVPESGDFMQAMKAGLMEIADIFVVNKADRDGAKQMVNALKFLTESPESGTGAWQVPILLTNGLDGSGTKDAFETVRRHTVFLEHHRQTGQFLRKRQHGLKQLIVEQLSVKIEDLINEVLADRYRAELMDPSVSLYSIFNRVMQDKGFTGKLFG